MVFSFGLLLRLEALEERRLKIAWEAHEDAERLAATLPRLLPLLEEESLADANVPYSVWLDAARGREKQLHWILRHFDAESFDSLGLPVEWSLGRSRLSRTALRLPCRRAFFHGGSLVSGRDVRVREEIEKPPLRIRKLARAEAERGLDAARAALGTRYRELHGFTHGDSRSAIRAEGPRGLEIYLSGLKPDRRLPLRAGFAHLVARNGLPIGYGDGLALFERLDLSFNIFPEYRDGESAFVLATLLKAYSQVLGVTTFSIEPYQIGEENEEAIASGAFWFYRRIGFRSASADIEKLARQEEARVAADRAHRTSARMLRRLAGSNMLLETRNSRLDDSRHHEWDRFHIRNLGLSVQREMARRGCSTEDLRERCADRVARLLSARPSRWPESRFRAFSDLALVLDRIPDLARWSRVEKQALAGILRAKSAPSETGYVRLLQEHARLRKAILKLGSKPV